MYSYQLITPDGQTFDLSLPRYVVQDGILDSGFGLPPITHSTQDIYRQPGALLRSIQIQPRVVTIQANLMPDGECYNLHDLRKALWNSLRWNRTTDDPPKPSILRYIRDGHVANLNVYYLSDVSAQTDGITQPELVGIRLIAYDPLWHGSSTTSALAVQSSVTVSYIIGKINGAWSAMGNAGTQAVFALAFSNDRKVLYIGGNFTNWNGIAAADYVAQYTIATGVWAAIGTGTDGTVNALAIGPDGALYAGGTFTHAGGVAAARVAKWNGAAWSAMGAGVDNTCYALAAANDGTIYAGGEFHNAGGGAAAHIAQWNGTIWQGLTSGTDADVRALMIAPTGYLYVGGGFTHAGGFAANRISTWSTTGSFWQGAGGFDASVLTLLYGLDGSIYAGGLFSVADTTTVNHVARNAGAGWQALGSGMNDSVYTLAQDSDGIIYAGGVFTAAGGYALSNRVAAWNGSVWTPLDITLPGSPTVFVAASSGSDIYFGFSTTGAVVSSVVDSITVSGDADTYPIFTITGPGTLQWIENVYTGKIMAFNCVLLGGETATIDLSPGVKTFMSDFRGNLMAYAMLLPSSDFGTFAFSSDPIAPLGVNHIAILVTGTTPVEQGDTSNQLSGWANITGITYLNTGAGGKLWASIISDGAGFYHIALYKDSARTLLVGHTATYNGAGAKAIVADNASGLGGTITVDAVTVASTAIVAYSCTLSCTYTSSYLSADAAVV